MLHLLLSAICRWCQHRAHRCYAAQAPCACCSCKADALSHSDAVTAFPAVAPPLLAPAAIWTLRQRSPHLCYAYLATLCPAELIYSAQLFTAYAHIHHLCHTSPQALLAIWQRRIAAYRRQHSLL